MKIRRSGLTLIEKVRKICLFRYWWSKFSNNTRRILPWIFMIFFCVRFMFWWTFFPFLGNFQILGIKSSRTIYLEAVINWLWWALFNLTQQSSLTFCCSLKSSNTYSFCAKPLFVICYYSKLNANAVASINFLCYVW